MPELNSGDIKRTPGSKSLAHALKTEDKDFIDFLTHCFIWEPDKRMTPEQGLAHKWITKGIIKTSAEKPTAMRNTQKLGQTTYANKTTNIKDEKSHKVNQSLLCEIQNKLLANANAGVQPDISAPSSTKNQNNNGGSKLFLLKEKLSIVTSRPSNIKKDVKHTDKTNLLLHMLSKKTISLKQNSPK